jgi:hypothetical protein
VKASADIFKDDFEGLDKALAENSKNVLKKSSLNIYFVENNNIVLKSLLIKY